MRLVTLRKLARCKNHKEISRKEVGYFISKQSYKKLKVQDPVRGMWEIAVLKQHIQHVEEAIAPRMTIQEAADHRDNLCLILEYPARHFGES